MCRDAYPKWLCYCLWIVAEVAIAATDLAEVIGSATALYLLFGIPLWAGVLITAVDVLIILILGMKNLRVLEFIVFVLIFLIFGIFVYELAAANPNWADVGKGFIPRPRILTGEQSFHAAAQTESWHGSCRNYMLQVAQPAKHLQQQARSMASTLMFEFASCAKVVSASFGCSSLGS